MKLYLLFASILAVILTLTGAAVAEPTQNWNDLLVREGIDAASAQTATHTVILGHTEEALDVALTVEGIYYDGKIFLLGFRTENLQPQSPALVLYTDVMINGTTAIAKADYPVSLWYPRIFGLEVAGEPLNNLMWGFDANMDYFSWNGEVEISSHFTVMRPYKPIVIVDAEIHNAYDTEDMEKDRQAMLAAQRVHGITVAQVDDTDVDAWKDKGYLVLNRYGDHHLGEWKEGDSVPALMGLDLPDCEKQEVVITFHVNLDNLIM